MFPRVAIRRIVEETTPACPVIQPLDPTHVTLPNLQTEILLRGKYRVAVATMNSVTVFLQIPCWPICCLLYCTRNDMTQVYMNQHSFLSVCSLTLITSGYYQHFYPTSFRLNDSLHPSLSAMLSYRKHSRMKRWCGAEGVFFLYKKRSEKYSEQRLGFLPTALLGQARKRSNQLSLGFF